MRNVRQNEAQAGIKILGEITITSDMQMTPPLWKKAKKKNKQLKSLLIRVKEENKKNWLKLNIQKTKIMAFGAITFGK